MLPKGAGQYYLINLSALVLFIVDRLLKIYFVKNPAEIFDGVFFNLISFHFEKNFGVAFGILFNQLVLLILIILLIFGLFWFLLKSYQQKDIWQTFGLTLIVVGAISNLIDRWRYGYVVDYIDVTFFTVLNLADVIISTGVVILILELFIKKRPVKQ